MTAKELYRHAYEIRKRILSMHYHAKSGHIGGALSCVDILTYLYGECFKPSSNYAHAACSFILSKGHAASAWYATAHQFYPEAFPNEIRSYHTNGTYLGVHPHPSKSVATGSLGHGLPIAAGIAYARKYFLGDSNPVYCLISDGDIDEGSTWEAINFACDHKLDNLKIILDANGFKGFSEEKSHGARTIFKLEKFNIEVHRFPGHTFERMPILKVDIDGKPQFYVAETIKGKGVSFMENKLEWHYLPMNQAQYEQAMKELKV